jgi:hypothetical protein
VGTPEPETVARAGRARGRLVMVMVTVPVPREGLDGIQQRLYAVALGLRSLRTGAVPETVAGDLERLEMEVDGLIREVRSLASGRPR